MTVAVVAATMGVLLLSAGRAEAEPAGGRWRDTGSLGLNRQNRTATRLGDGKVLVVGGSSSGTAATAELYDPAATSTDGLKGAWSPAAPPGAPRDRHTATLLDGPSCGERCGKVLVVGGSDPKGAALAELYDPVTNTWSPTPPAPTPVARYGHTATLLADGKVLVAGGRQFDTQNATSTGTVSVSLSAQVYDPAANTWKDTGNLRTAVAFATATLLPSNKVLVAGGATNTFSCSTGEATRFCGTPTTFAQLYDPDATDISGRPGRWDATGAMSAERGGSAAHTATLLQSGKVLVADGRTVKGATEARITQLYDPDSGTWSHTGSTISNHYNGLTGGGPTATLLPSGKVLLTGDTATPEVYDPVAAGGRGGWSEAPPMTYARAGEHSATLLADGTVLVAGGRSLSTDLRQPEEVYDPSLPAATGAWRPTTALNVDRSGHTATDLRTPVGGVGGVLVVGGTTAESSATAEVYNYDLPVLPSLRPWTMTAPLTLPRTGHTATLLDQGLCAPRCGMVLVVGGEGAAGPTAELFDPATNAWQPAQPMPGLLAHSHHTATALPSGKVLVAGGFQKRPQDTEPQPGGSAHLYDPATDTWAPTGSLVAGTGTNPAFAVDAVATLLPNGTVLRTGGAEATSDAQLYDDKTGTGDGVWTSVPMNRVHKNATATLLDDGPMSGNVIVVSASADSGRWTELYETSTNTWKLRSSPTHSRGHPTATARRHGLVLVVGTAGPGSEPLPAEIYNPMTDAWHRAPPNIHSRDHHTATNVSGSNDVLVAGGRLSPSDPGSNIEELYDLLSDPVFAALPAAPTGLVAGVGGTTLTWNANAEVDLAGYNVYRSTAVGGAYTRMNQALLTTTSYADSTAQNGVTYFYVVRAEDLSGNESSSSNVVSVTPDSVLAVSDVTVAEGNAGSVPATFTITRSGTTTGSSTVSYTTPSSGTATAGSDYTAVPPTTVTFAPGETTTTVAATVLGDAVVEPTESFSLVLSAPTGATLSDFVGSGTIVNDDALPTLAVGDVTVVEGHAGSSVATLTITRSGDTTGTSTVSYTTPSNGAATAGIDYTAVPPTTVTFAAGETTKAVSVSVLGDTASEPSEAFYLVLSAPTGATISDSIGTALIVNDDALPTLAVGDVSRAEGNAGSAPLTFTITRSGGTTGTSSVSYTTTAGTATAGTDYTAIAPTRVTFNPGETAKTVAVNVLGDTAFEANETFSLVLSSPVGATVSDTAGPATIFNDDGQPTLAVGDVTVTEGNTGSTPATFTITRSGATTGTSTVSYTTPSNGTATAGSDYTAVAPTTVSFAPGETAKTVTVSVLGDTTVEANEFFYLALSAPTGATLADYLGTGHIVNDEGTISPGPSTFLGVSDVTVAEADTGTTPASFTITRSGVTTGTSTVSYTTTPGTAAAGSDYTAIAPTTVTFAPGETTKPVAVNILGDSTVEANETFSLTLSSPSGATVSDTTGSATIANDDALPTLAVSDVTVAEGNTGTAPATFTISRTGVTTGTSTVSYATSPGTATAGTDYTAIAPTILTFAPGETTKTVAAAITGDTAVEANEHFNLVLSAPTGATLADNIAPAFIINDDQLPTITLNDVTVAEGNTGTGPATFTITRTGPTTGTSTVSYTTTPGTATAGSDYTAIPRTTVTFAAGETIKTVAVTVFGDTAVEANESFSLILSAPTGATLSDTAGYAFIVNDDATTLSVSDVSVNEGNAGTTAATFTITRSGSTAGTSTVSYTTPVTGTATAGTDYTAIAPTTLTFNPGETTKTVPVTVIGDATVEPTETFTLVLSAPTGTTLADNSGRASIVNDDY